MERELQRYKKMRRDLMQIQEDLIYGRVDMARKGISRVLMDWPYGI